MTLNLNEFLVTAIALSRRRDIRTYLNELLDNIEDEISGGFSPLTLLGPYSVAYNDANVANPANSGGAQIGPAIAAGSVLLGVWTTNTQAWAAADGFDEFDINLGPTVGDSAVVATLSYPGGSVGDPVQGWLVYTAPGSNALAPRLLTATCHLFFAAWSTNEAAITAGASTVSALVYTP